MSDGATMSIFAEDNAPVRDALLQGVDNSHVVRLLVRHEADGAFNVMADWRHPVPGAPWCCVPISGIRKIIHACTTELATTERGEAGLWAVARALERAVHELARLNRLGELTGCVS